MDAEVVAISRLLAVGALQVSDTQQCLGGASGRSVAAIAVVHSTCPYLACCIITALCRRCQGYLSRHADPAQNMTRPARCLHTQLGQLLHVFKLQILSGTQRKRLPLEAWQHVLVCVLT